MRVGPEDDAVRRQGTARAVERPARVADRPVALVQRPARRRRRHRLLLLHVVRRNAVHVVGRVAAVRRRRRRHVAVLAVLLVVLARRVVHEAAGPLQGPQLRVLVEVAHAAGGARGPVHLLHGGRPLLHRAYGFNRAGLQVRVDHAAVPLQGLEAGDGRLPQDDRVHRAHRVNRAQALGGAHAAAAVLEGPHGRGIGGPALPVPAARPAAHRVGLLPAAPVGVHRAHWRPGTARTRALSGAMLRSRSLSAPCSLRAALLAPSALREAFSLAGGPHLWLRPRARHGGGI